MTFPTVERVVYEKLPLNEVICQLRFPPILSIDLELPAKFQETIRQDFPLFNDKTNLINVNLPKDILQNQLPQEIIGLSPAKTKNYEFISRNGKIKINLTNNFFAVSTKEYVRWEYFKENLINPFEAFLSIYNPVMFTRIGLRYKNIIQRSKLGLNEVNWTELIKPYLLGVLSETKIKSLNVSHTSEIQLEDKKSIVRISDGLVESLDNGEICYIIDNDFFIEDQLEIEEAIPKLDYFNQRSGRLFRWCITDLLHNAMEPNKP